MGTSENTRKFWELDPHYCFDPEPRQRALAAELYNSVRTLPLISPHGHVDARLLADPKARFGSPAELFVIPDHYILRMLYSQGVSLEALGVPTRDGSSYESNHRKVWQRFAEHFHLFRGTPTGLWLRDELITVFDIREQLNGDSAQRIYDELEAKLARPEYSPRALLARFNLEVLATTNAATDRLEAHQALRAEGWHKVRPTFRPDAVVNLDGPDWLRELRALSEVSGIAVEDYRSYIAALEQRRGFFREMGTFASDYGPESPHSERLSPVEADAIFARALRGQASQEDARRFGGHMLIELARMSAEDGLVMQLHVGSVRNHNPLLFRRFGPDVGADIPVAAHWTRGLRALLEAFGNDPRLQIILFTLDESVYSRELAPLAGHYPVLRLGAPWWFFDSVKGVERFLDAVVETAGIYNLAGFNDDTRAFASIPARHDLWRRVVSNWLAGLSVRGLVDREEALDIAHQLAYQLAKSAYRLGEA